MDFGNHKMFNSAGKAINIGRRHLMRFKQQEAKFHEFYPNSSLRVITIGEPNCVCGQGLRDMLPGYDECPVCGYCDE